MKREIKFRGKRLDNGEWAYGSLISCYRFTDIWWPSSCGHVEKREVAPETVGQYTGMNDRYGKEIYEGDIVKWDDCSRGKYWRFAVVKINPDIQFDCSEIHSFDGVNNSTSYIFRFGNFAYKDTEKHLYVIGNIHDNPEKMKA